MHYTRTYDAELLADALEPVAHSSIGLLATYQLGYGTGSYLVERYPGARFTEASDLVDGIKAVKSDEEQDLIRAAAALQDEVMEIALAAIEPGKRESARSPRSRGTRRRIEAARPGSCCAEPDRSAADATGPRPPPEPCDPRGRRSQPARRGGRSRWAIRRARADLHGGPGAGARPR